MNRNLILASVFGSLLAFTSCNRDVINEPIVEQSLRIPSAKEVSMEKFANLLSKATYERQDVREFLKKEAVVQFDKNYDIFYPLVKDKNVSGETFRDILVSYSSNKEIEEIERNVPFLNILIPKIAFFDVNPEDLDVQDNEIPVAISKEFVTALYLNGKKDFEVAKGQIPDFHTFVINENTRVAPIEDIEPQAGLQGSTRGINGSSYAFKSPNYDGSRKNIHTFSAWTGNVGQRAKDAYNYFYKDDGSINQKAFQRDYIYYGITPQNQKGSLNRSVSEYISFIEVNPRVYYQISDQRDTGNINDDPYLRMTYTDEEKRELGYWEMVHRMWSYGSYNFEFQITTSVSNEPIKINIPLDPHKIWYFNHHHERRHGSFWRRSKNFYWMNPIYFTAKRVWLEDQDISFGKWDLSEESLYRFVDIYEIDDVGIKKTVTTSYESVRVKSTQFDGDVKTTIGLTKNVKADIGGSVSISGSNTVRETKTVTIEKNEASDHLGRVKIYFYDPIIEGKSGDQYKIHYYNTGSVKFGISVK